MTLRMFLAIALVGSLSACGQSDAGSEPGGQGGTSGNAGAAGSAGTAGGGGGGAAGGGAGAAGGGAGGKGDFDVLSACSSGACTRPSSAQLIEGFTQHIDRPSVTCVLTALRDRTPGRYTHGTDSTFTNGSVGAGHALVVAADGATSYARRRYASGAFPVPYEPEPAQRCVLKASSYFDACLAALERTSGGTDPEAWSCAFGDGGVTSPSSLSWFESCETESPASCP